MDISVTDLVANDFKNKHVLQTLNLFLNDYCRTVFDGSHVGTLDDCDTRLYLLCKTLGFVNSREMWRGGCFDDAALQVLFTNADFTKLKMEFDTWQFDNRQTCADELSCR